jgi:predicted phosphodiesterase
MKIRSWVLLGLLVLFCAIVFFPWFEIVITVVIGIFLGSYLHYWKSKATYGPYLYYGADPGTQMWINFVLVSATEIARKNTYYVEISPSKLFHSGDSIRISPTRVIDEAGRVYLHFFCADLQPMTQYYYRIGYQQKITIGGRKHSFRTAPTSNSPIEPDVNRFIIYGDDQTADFFPILAQITNHYQLAAQPTFIVHLGDINQNLWHDPENNAFFQTKRKIFRRIPYLPVLGNHDAKPITRYDAIYTLPHWYAFDYGSQIRILCLSGYDGFVPQTNGQYEFIEHHLQTGTQANRFIIVCVHETFFGIETNIPEEQPTLELRQYVLPLLKQYNRGLQRNIVVFSGHIHEYCRILRDDLTFIIEGACSNAKWYSALHDDAAHTYDPSIAAKEYGRQSFALLTIQNETLIVEIRGWGKKIVESLEFRL